MGLNTIYQLIVYSTGGQPSDLSNTLSATPVGTNVAPAITLQPSSASVVEGNTAFFNVSASGTPSPTYQWQTDNEQEGQHQRI